MHCMHLFALSSLEISTPTVEPGFSIFDFITVAKFFNMSFKAPQAALIYDSYLLCNSSPMGGSNSVQRSRFQIEGRRTIAERRSTNTAWSVTATACSTAVLASLPCHNFLMIS